MPSFSTCVVLIALPIVHGFMIETRNGFVPMNLLMARAGEGLPIPLKNNKDLSYLVS